VINHQRKGRSQHRIRMSATAVTLAHDICQIAFNYDAAVRYFCKLLNLSHETVALLDHTLHIILETLSFDADLIFETIKAVVSRNECLAFYLDCFLIELVWFLLARVDNDDRLIHLERRFCLLGSLFIIILGRTGYQLVEVNILVFALCLLCYLEFQIEQFLKVVG